MELYQKSQTLIKTFLQYLGLESITFSDISLKKLGKNKSIGAKYELISKKR